MPRDENDARPDPAVLLEQARREELRARRGRLRIFFGAAPGVGKTYAMLSAAQRLSRDGTDVLVGIAQTHGRAETEEKLWGLKVLPRRSIDYRGTTLTELDLDAALERKPQVLVLDELAHTNAPGSRFEKRWQDARALLEAGISVFTTMNVQHIESLNDVVVRITGVTVRETVPDAIVEEADDIELVDLPPDALLERLQQGKVYVPESIRASLGAFFRKGNLTALRELALRRTAEWVDAQMREYKEGRRIRSVWPAAERMLVAVSPSPTSRTLVRAARRMATGMRAHLIAAFVEKPSARLSPAANDRVMQTLRLAESLGAETALLSGVDAAAELVAFARSRNVNRIVVGKTGRSRLREALFGSFVNQLIRESGDIDTYVIRDRSEQAAALPHEPAQPRAPASLWRTVRALGGAIAVVAVCTALAALDFRPPDLSEEVMILMLGVVVTALRWGRGPAVVAACLSVVVCNFFFTEPYFTFRVEDQGYLVALAVMLVVGLVIATLTSRMREQTQAARERAHATAALYSLSRELAAARDRDEVCRVAVRHVHDTFGGDASVLVPEAGRARLTRLSTYGSPDWLDEHERGVARWSLDHAKHAGAGTEVLPASIGHYVPLSASQGKVGVLALRPVDRGALDARARLLLETFANQIALALERVLLIESQQAARLEAESERLRGALLSAVSHDLRTPLAGITGAASTLLDEQAPLDDATRRELVGEIFAESRRLGDLIASIVFATRLSAGPIQLAREWTTVEEIVGAGLARLRERFDGHVLRTSIPRDLPMIRVDAAMFAQVIHNLVDNALRYTEPGSPIEVGAWASDTHVHVQVADEGPGLAPDEVERVFERLWRGRAALASGSAGMGLGLTICAGIVQAHGGRLQAENRTPHGAAFTFTVPIERPQPELPNESDA